MKSTKKAKKMKIMVLNGPNLNLLGIREPAIYGSQNYATLERMIRERAAELGVEVDIRQTNHEGVLVDWIQETLNGYDGIVINPAAYTHSSIAILDALKGVMVPAVEVHISEIHKRDTFRHISYAGVACEKTITGLGFEGYLRALEYLVETHGPKAK